MPKSGAPAGIAGAMTYPLDGERGIFTAAQVEAAVRGQFRHNPRSALVHVENTSNGGGGTVWPLERLREVTDVARRHKLATHLDGARLMNACVAGGMRPAEVCAFFDSCWLDFSKGLGAPVGACLAGSRSLIDEAWRIKQQLGGAMRQAGIIAAAALYALDHHVERLADDHTNARRLATGLAELPGLRLDPETVETNLVYFEVAQPGLSADTFCHRLAEHGVRMGAMGPDLVRAVTHLDVDGAGIDQALHACKAVLEAA